MVLMYSKDDGPRTSGDEVSYEDVKGGVVGVVMRFLEERAELAKSYGVKKVILDPGMGAFVSGEASYSYEIIDRVEEMEGLGNELGCEILLGTSRKGFLGGGDVNSDERLWGTLATTCWLRGRVDYLRVHDVLANVTVVG